MTSTRSLTILFAEDDPSAREVITIILEMEGYTLVTAHNGSAALATLLRHRKVELLISDIYMPGGISGIQLAKRGIAAFPELKVILVSGDHSSSYEDFPTSTCFLLKPYDRKGLLRAIENVMG
jgi:CheY-like chemotaxis protein